MSSIGSGFSWLTDLLIGGWPILILVLIVLLAAKSGNKNNPNNKTVAQSSANSNPEPVKAPATPPTPPTPPKPKDGSSGINVMLLAGCLLLVFGIIKFFNDTNDTLVAPVAIILTLVFYALGYAIYSKVNYLKVVGGAFSYISLAIFPFWAISFNTFGVSIHNSWIIASIITFCALLLTTYLYKSKVLSFITYLWMFIVAWAFMPETEYSTGFSAATYWFFISSSIISIIPAIIWKLKPNWLPVYFRKATQVFGFWFMPFLMMFSIYLLFVPNLIVTAPFLRTLVAAVALAWGYLYWSIDRSHGWAVALRFLAQGLLLTITMDSLNYSLTSLSFFRNDVGDGVRLGIITVWLISFLIQTIVSLFIPKEDEKAKLYEHRAEIISLVGIFTTPIFTIGLQDPVSTTVNLIICAVVAALGVVYTIAHNNPRWSVATMLALVMARMVIEGSSMAAGWTAWSDVFYFTITSGIVLGMYQLFRKYSEGDSFALTMTGLIVSSLAVVISSLRAEYAEVGWLITALYLALFGFLSKKSVLYEMSIYSGAFCLYSLTGTIGEMLLPNTMAKCVTGPLTIVQPCSGYDAAGYVNWIAGINVIRSFIIGAALTAVSYFKERKLEKNAQIRFYIGYFIMSLGLFLVGCTAGEYWMVFCLAVQVAYLVYAAINDIDWLVWVTIIAMPICAFSMTGGFTYIWYVVLGLTLIGAVIWRLSKANRQKLAAEQQQKPVGKAPKN